MAATGATTALGAMGVAARGAGSALMGAFGGPIGIAITAVTGLLISMWNEGRNTQAAFEANAVAAEKFGVKLSDVSKAALVASGETAGVGSSAAGAEPAIWSFSNASGNLTRQLWEQAKAARAARVELLMSQKAEAEKRIMTGADATWEGSRRLSRNSNEALMRGDVLESASLGWKSIVSDFRNALSGGRTGREGLALATDSGKIAGAIQKEIDKLNSTPIGKTDLPTPTGTPPAAPTGTHKKDSAASEAERKAKAQAEFWKNLEQEVELSKLNTQEREKLSKVYDYQQIVGRKITDQERDLLNASLDQVKANNLINQASENHRQKMIDLDTQQALLDKKMSGATEEQLAIEKAALDFAAQLKKDNLTLDERTLTTLTEQVRTEAKRTAEIEKQNRLLAVGASAAEQYSKSYAETVQRKGFAEQRAGIVALYNSGQNPEFTKAQYDEAIKGLDTAIGDAAKESGFKMADIWGQTIEDLGDDIGGIFGKAFRGVGKLVQSLVAGAQGDVANAGPLGRVASLLGGDVQDGFKEASGGILDGLKGIFGKTGDFGKTLGKALGTAGAGAQIGSLANTGLNMLGIKSSGTGSSIGGALGALSGIPGGSIVGGLLGGVLGGMFKKAKYGTASIAQLAGGELGVGSIKGNKSSLKDNANTAAGSVISGLQDIAAQLGATLTGSPSVSIGQYKKDWRVSDTGRTGKLKGKYSDVKDFGDDAEAAIAYAIQVALQDGILTGISEFSQRVIKANGDEKALSLAQSYESILDSLAKFNNPIKGAVDDAVKDLDTLANQMKAAGATSAELANVEKYRSIKLKEVLDDTLSDFNDTLKMLQGSASGKSPLELYQEDMKELDKYRQTLANGGTVDSADFNNLVQEIASQAGDLFGTQTSAYQNAIGDLTTLTQAAIGNATTEFNNAAMGAEGTTAAVNETTNAVNTQTGVLEEIRDLIAQGAGAATIVKSAFNGKLVNPS